MGEQELLDALADDLREIVLDGLRAMYPDPDGDGHDEWGFDYDALADCSLSRFRSLPVEEKARLLGFRRTDLRHASIDSWPTHRLWVESPPEEQP